MTKTYVADWMNVRRLGPAQRLLALRRLEEAFEGDERLEPFRRVRERALRVNERAVQDQRTFEREAFERALYKERARDLDTDLDRLISLVHGLLDGARRALPQGSPDRATAHSLYEQMFPRGLAAIIQRPFVEQHQLVLGMLDAVRDDSGDYVPAATRLGLMTFLSSIEEINSEYGQALTDATASRSFDDVRALDAEAHRAYAAVVLGVLAAYPSDLEAERARRNEILAPVRAQEEESRRRRGDGSDGATSEDDADEDMPSTL